MKAERQSGEGKKERVKKGVREAEKRRNRRKIRKNRRHKEGQEGS